MDGEVESNEKKDIVALKLRMEHDEVIAVIMATVIARAAFS